MPEEVDQESQKMLIEALSEGSKELTADDMSKIIRSLRDENAKHRTEKRDLKAAAEKWAAYEETQKTELQKLQDERDRLAQELQGEKLSKLRAKAAKEAGLDPALADRIRGNSLDEMLDDAQELAEAAKVALKPNLNQGVTAGQGEALRAGTDDAASGLANWLQGQLFR